MTLPTPTVRCLPALQKLRSAILLLFVVALIPLLLTGCWWDSSSSTEQTNTTNQPPVAHAGVDQTVEGGDIVTLDGSASYDPGSSIIKYEWKQIAGTTVTLSDSNAVKPTFTAPDVINETLIFELMVSDNGGKASTIQVKINVEKIVVRAELAPNAEIVPASVLSAPATKIESVASGGVLLTLDSASLPDLTVGKTLLLPATPSQGLHFPFSGKIISVNTSGGSTNVELYPANVEDVYSSLSWDIDTLQSGATIVGTVAAPNAKVSFSTSPVAQAKSVPTITDTLELDGNTLKGGIKFEYEMEYKGKKVVLFAETELEQLSVRSKGDYDVKRIASADGWAEFSAVTKGNLSGKFGVKAPDFIEIPTLADLIAEQDVWDNLKWEGSDKYKLEGLEKDDKQGRIPLGGIIITPCLGGVCPLKFKGNLGDNTVHLFSIAPTVIVWVYADFNGNISFSGESGVRVRGHQFEQGYEFKAVKGNLDAKRIDVSTTGAFEFYAQGELETMQRAGASVAADILVGGIRPASVSAFVGGRYEGSFKGDGAYAILPSQGWSGYACVENKIWAGIEIDANFRIKAEVPVDLKFKKFEIGGVIERAISSEVATFLDKNLGSSCVVSDNITLSATLLGIDENNADNVLVKIDFADTYKNKINLRYLTDEWLLHADCLDDDCTPVEYTIPSYRQGIDTISLPKIHDYTLTLKATHETFGVIKQTSVKLPLMSINPQVKIGDGKVTLQWTHPQRATKYSYCYSDQKYDSSCSSYDPLSSQWQDIQDYSSFTVSSLINGKPYFFYVVGIDENGVPGLISNVEVTPVKSIISDFTDLDPEVENSTLNVGLDTSDGTLRLSFKDDGSTDQTFPYIWIANSGEGTISKLDTKTGVELGRYRTGPGNGNPSRTTVDQDGNVWVGNRNNNTITKVGLKEFDQCIDRNSNGMIDTSTGGTDVKAWNGYFGDGQGIANAEDECILQHIVLSASGIATPSDIRLVAIDPDNNVFAGGSGSNSLFKVNGKTGAIIKAMSTSQGHYGGVVDKAGNLWSMQSGSGQVQKVDKDMSTTQLINVGHGGYGIAIDKYGKIWTTALSGALFSVFEPDDPVTSLRVFNHTNYYAQGIATDANGDIFMAGSLWSDVVEHYKQEFDAEGKFSGVTFVASYNVGSGPTGVAVDGSGKVWSANINSNSASRIDPTTGNVEHFSVGYGPYNYSDMTGRVVRTITKRQGTWEATFNGKELDYPWNQVSWKLKTDLPAGTSVKVFAKVANTEIDLNAQNYVEVQNAQPISDLKGQYLKLKVELASEDLTSTPEVIELQLY